MTEKFSEKNLVEDYIVGQLVKLGWKFVPAEELERESLEEPLLVSNLIRAIKRINKASEIGDDEVGKVLNELKLVATGQEGAKKILNFYRFGVPVKVEKEGVVKFVQLFDYGGIEILRDYVPQNDSRRSGQNDRTMDQKGQTSSGTASPTGDSPLAPGDNGANEFIVTRQVYYKGKDRIRTDIVLYVNGIPLVNIECKDPTAPGLSWYDAYRDVKHYEDTVPELYKYIQIGAAAETKARYFPIIPWQTDVDTSEWRADSKNSTDSLITIFEPLVLLDIIKNFIFFRVKFGNASKAMARYMQYRAANRIVNRVIASIESLGSKESKGVKGSDSIDPQDSTTPRLKRHGLIWHWQGSGKTLTMIFAAHKLFYARELETPSIFFIVDRIDLEDQLCHDEFATLDILQPEPIDSVSDLRDILRHDEYQGKRGIFITLVHKFRPEELSDLQKEIEAVSRDRETIMSRRNVVAFVDEGHRTQYGTLAGQMKALFRNAFRFALTGTPISKLERDTYTEFSYPPDELYLDKYFITDSQKDHFTVKIAYQPRLEQLHLKKDQLETFLQVELEEIPAEIRAEVDKKTKAKLNAIKVILENPERIKVIAKDIANHFKENVDGKFKAMVVAASRMACVHYKEELDTHLPKEYSEIVMTSTKEDRQPIYSRMRELRERHAWKDLEDIRKELINRYKENEYPKILIVTDMLLTGFDAPILQTMYLDKLLKEHRLLQAIARTNRPYKDLKEAGVIIDYVGILKEFKRAFEMYSKEDVAHVLLDNEGLRKEFVDLITETGAILGSLDRDYKRETLLKAIEILTADTEKEEAFIDNYRELRKKFELLGPDEVKLEYFELYKWLSAIYTYHMKLVVQTGVAQPYVQKYYEKTVKFVHKTTEIEKLEMELPTVTFDNDYLTRLEERVKSKEEKAANILFTLERMVLVERNRSPIYESLADRVERMMDLWREKTKDYERIYSEGVRILEDINKLGARQQKLGFSNLQYALLMTLEAELGPAEPLIKEAGALSAVLDRAMFPGWIVQATATKQVEREVRRFVRQLKSKYGLTMDRIDVLFDQLMAKLKVYGV